MEKFTIAILAFVLGATLVTWHQVEVSPHTEGLSIPEPFQAAWDDVFRDSAVQGCGGIANFYSGNFESDVLSVLKVPYNESVLKNPQEFWSSNSGDCKSRSQTVMCLCAVYNKSCEFYAEYSMNKHISGTGCFGANCSVGHLGVQVFEGEAWRRLV